MRVTVLGGGSWGTALAWLLAGKGFPVHLWCRDAEQAAAMARDRVNARYLPDLSLPDPVAPTANLEAALAGAGLVVVAVPTRAVRVTLQLLPGRAPETSPVVLAAKGLERESGLRLSEVAADELGAGAPVAVLSGPNLSGEVVRGVPTATVIASASEAVARELRETFGTPAFRVYTNADLPGVELGGALKNPIAVAAGISDGLGFGENTKAALLTRGLAEMIRLGTAAGGRAATFSGLSGLGDLLATSHSPLSRNYRLGLALGRGASLDHALESLRQTAEGVPTTDAACRLAARLEVEVPILTALRGVLFQAMPVREAVTALLARPYRDEDQQD